MTARRRLLAGAVLCALLAPGCSSDRERFEAHMERAAEFAHSGRPQEALLELRSALALDPDDAVANHKAGVLLDNAGQTADAVFFYREAYRLDPGRSDDALAAARLSSTSDPATARRIVEEVLARSPEDPDAHAHLATIALVEGNGAVALELAERAVELGPDIADAWLALGQVHQARIRELRLRNQDVDDAVFEAALAAFDRAIALHGPGGQGELERARVLATWPARADEAPAAFQLALENAFAHSYGPRLQHTLQSVLEYGRDEDRDTRRFALERAIEHSPEVPALWRELALMEEAATAGAGEAVFRRGARQNPGVPELTRSYAAYLTRHGRSDEARALLDGALADAPDALVLHVARFELASSQGDRATARETLERMREIDPAAPKTVKVEVQVEASRGRFDPAARKLRELAERAPDREGLRMLAQIELRLRNLAAAEAAADRLIELAGERPPTPMYLLRAEIRSARGDFAGTRADLERVAGRGARLGPRDSLRLARSLWAEGRRDQARALLEAQLSGPARAEATLLYVQRLGDAPEAREAADRALAEHPDHADLIAWRADQQARQGQPGAALARLDAAIEGGTVSPRMRLLRARLRLAARDPDGALADASWVYERGGPGAAEVLTEIHTATGRLGEVVDEYESAARAGSLELPGAVLLAHFYAALSRDDEAIALLEQALADGARRPGAKRALAMLLAERGEDLDRALALAAAAKARTPDDPHTVHTLGAVYLRRGESRRALAQFEDALALGPGSAALEADLHYRAGLALQELGRSEEAEQAFALSRRLQPARSEENDGAGRS